MMSVYSKSKRTGPTFPILLGGGVDIHVLFVDVLH